MKGLLHGSLTTGSHIADEFGKINEQLSKTLIEHQEGNNQTREQIKEITLTHVDEQIDKLIDVLLYIKEMIWVSGDKNYNGIIVEIGKQFEGLDRTLIESRGVDEVNYVEIIKHITNLNDNHVMSMFHQFETLKELNYSLKDIVLEVNEKNIVEAVKRNQLVIGKITALINDLNVSRRSDPVLTIWKQLKRWATTFEIV